MQAWDCVQNNFIPKSGFQLLLKEIQGLFLRLLRKFKGLFKKIQGISYFGFLCVDEETGVEIIGSCLKSQGLLRILFY